MKYYSACHLLSGIVFVNVSRKREDSKWKGREKFWNLKSRIKIKYMQCNLSITMRWNECMVHIDGQNMPRTSHFRYLGIIICEDDEIGK